MAKVHAKGSPRRAVRGRLDGGRGRIVRPAGAAAFSIAPAAWAARPGAALSIALAVLALLNLLALAYQLRRIAARRRDDREGDDAGRQFRTLADSIPQLAWMAEPDGQVTWYNRRWYDYTGTTPEQMRGRGLSRDRKFDREIATRV